MALVEVTGNEFEAVADTLAVIGITLQGLGFTLYDIKTDSRSSADSLKDRIISLEPNLVNQTLGIMLSAENICKMLKKCKIGRAHV